MVSSSLISCGCVQCCACKERNENLPIESMREPQWECPFLLPQAINSTGCDVATRWTMALKPNCVIPIDVMLTAAYLSLHKACGLFLKRRSLYTE